MNKIATDLTDEARKDFEAWIAANAKAGASTDYSVWWDQLNFDENGLHFELAGRYTKMGNPTTTSYGLKDCVLADIED